MSLYQFLIAVRQEGGAQLTNENGETTSHLMGMFYRTIRMVDNGIKPVYVFDGKPPQMKAGELEKRKEKRDEAQAALDKAKEDGDMEEVDKQNRRLVKPRPSVLSWSKEGRSMQRVQRTWMPSLSERIYYFAISHSLKLGKCPLKSFT